MTMRIKGLWQLGLLLSLGAITVEGRDEASALLDSLNQMQDFLRSLVSQVRVSGESIGTASAEIGRGSSFRMAATRLARVSP